jgi:hypothetical protein
VASPGTLLREIRGIKRELYIYRVLGGFMFALLLAILLIPTYEWAVDYWQERWAINRVPPGLRGDIKSSDEQI